MTAMPDRQEVALRHEQLQADFGQFASRVAGGKYAHLVVMFGGTTYIQGIRANRPIRLTRCLAEMGVPVLFNFHRWRETDYIPPYEDELILQSPIDRTPKLVEQLVARPLGNTHGLFVASYPHPSVCRLINIANANGWATLYDSRDDWEAFHEVGMAKWYRPAVEKFVVCNCDVTCCVSRPLVKKLSAFTDRRPVRLLPNAYDPDFRSPDFARQLGEKVVIGYFGHLTDRWFDWESLTWIARQRPQYNFEIIGHGAPRDIEMPDNVVLLGQKTHPEICEVAKRWHVGIIPFRIGQLADGVDPIKIYEYFSLGLPVVSFRMPQIADYPHTTTVDTREAFVGAIDNAIDDQDNEEEFEDFLAQHTWEIRARQLLDWADEAIANGGCEKSLMFRETVGANQ